MKNWRYCSEDSKTISLHDHHISEIRMEDDGLVLLFAEGFDVERDNAMNVTGRHRQTGPSAVYLEGGRFLEGAFDRGTFEAVRGGDGIWHTIPVEEHPLDEKMFLSGLDLEVLSFTWFHEDRRVCIEADQWADLGPGTRTFCVISLLCGRLLFCWDELSADAWFQRPAAAMTE